MTNNPDKIEKLKACGINICNRVPLQIEANEIDAFYLKTKKKKCLICYKFDLIQKS